MRYPVCLPVRLYGILPILVYDPETTLEPQLVTPEVFLPEQNAVIRVKEAGGLSMTYTLAMVDEGLLDITRFRTPEPA